MNLFLKQVCDEFCDYLILMQVDRAGWHRSDTLVVPENIRLILQPPYSPELNPALAYLGGDSREALLQPGI